MTIVKVLGKTNRSYTDKSTGELKNYRAIHVEYTNRKESGLTGNMVEEMKPPMDIDMNTILIGQLYEVVVGRRGKYAYVEELRPVKA